jgi:MHS family alpha-ketoglutarate permease-like MFS transporter
LPEGAAWGLLVRVPAQTKTAPLTTAQRLRSILAGSVGNLVEWYDWYAYTVLALYFAPVFFPKGDAIAQQLDAAAIFAVGTLARPLGGLWLGRLSDRKGRKAGLLVSILLMCAGSLVIALTPGANRIGVAAPVILVLARLCQGLSVGGEFGASATYMSEIASAKNRGFWASFQYCTLAGGQILALGVLLLLQHFLTEAELAAWGWRIPFVLGAVLALVGMVVRRAALETPVFEAMTVEPRRAWGAALLADPAALLTVIGITAGGTIGFYSFTTYMQKYLATSGHWSKPAASGIVAVALLLYVLMQPLFGALSDRIGRLNMLLICGVLGVVFTVPLMAAIGAGTTRAGVLWPLMGALALISFVTSISGLVKAELFSAPERATGVAIGHSIGVALFGGTTEWIALWFKSIDHGPWFAWYVSAGFAALLLVAITQRARIRRGRIEAVG